MILIMWIPWIPVFLIPLNDMKRKHFLSALFALAVLGVSCSTADRDQVPQIPETTPDNPYTVPVKWWALEPLQGKEAAKGEISSLSAGFREDSRSYLEMNGAGTEAAVLWEAGDIFRMYSFLSNSYYTAVYSTAEGGAVADFTTYVNLPTSPCYAVYPGGERIGTYNGSHIFEVTIPREQTAVEGNIAPGYNFSYAYCINQGDDLHFINLVSLVHFRLSGGIAGEIRHITLNCDQKVSGDLIVVENGENASITRDISFSGAESYADVSLSGEFRPGVDYYLVLAPADRQLITMVFSNDEGNSVTKYGTKEVNFPQGRICDLGTIALGDSYDEDDPSMDPVLFLASSKPQPVTIAVIPDGYTEEELPLYEARAKSGINALFATEPYKSYKEYFNVWILKVASNGSGANITDGNGNVVTTSGCYFGSGWGENSYGDMQANDSRIFSFVETHCPDILNGLHPIKEVPVLLLINDERYGGRCWNWGDGKCYAMVPTTAGNLSWGYPSSCAVSDSDPLQGIRTVTSEDLEGLGSNSGDWRNTLVHEFGGHGFGRLSDEYWYTTDKGAVSYIEGHSWPLPMGLNISASYSTTPWDDDVLSRRGELVAQNPLYARIGVFQGGDVSILNRWRSEKISCMIDNRFYFSTWQRMIIVKRILSLAGEAFDADAFYALDHPEDPVRDVSASPVQGRQSAIAPIPVPPLAPMQVIVE